MTRDVGLLLLGIGLALVVSYFDSAGSQGDEIWLGLLVGALGLLLMAVPRVSTRLSKLTYPFCRRWRFKLAKPKVAVLLHAEIPSEESDLPATRFGPQDWISELSQVGLKARAVDATSNRWMKYAIVVNPYGEQYVEEDPLSLHTLAKIRRYMEKGGWFCQVGGAGFYYAWDPVSRRRVPLPPEITTHRIITTHEGDQLLEPRRLVGNLSLTNTPLQNLFGVSTTGGTDKDRLRTETVPESIEFAGDFVAASQGSTVIEYRSARPIATRAMIPLLQGTLSIDGQNRTFYPLVLVPVDLGVLLYGGMDLKGAGRVLGLEAEETLEQLTQNGLRLTCRALAGLVDSVREGRLRLPLRRVWREDEELDRLKRR